MDIERVLPELREPMKRAEVNAPRWLIRAMLKVMPVPKNPRVAVSMRRAGSVRLRIYRPESQSGAGLLWIHGGGLLFGDARQDEALCLSTAERLGVTIVSANYRFAPEHPFPAAHDDVHDAWRWLIAHANELAVDPARVAVGGESAGAGLAAALVQRIHDGGGAQPAGQWLFAPMLDDRTAARRELDPVHHFVWNNETNREAWSGFLGTEAGTVEPLPYAVAGRRTDLRGLPRTFITYGDIELFADEDAAYAAALELAGVPVTIDVVAGAAHGFENWAKATPSAETLIRRAQAWLEDVLR